MPNHLYHISETSDIKLFRPRPSPSFFEQISRDVVFAISERLLHNYLLPRDCPRVTYYATQKTSPEDREKFLTSGKEFVIAIEDKWLPAIQATKLYLYQMNPANFELLDENAGYYISFCSEIPIKVTALQDSIKVILSKGDVEIKILPCKTGDLNLIELANSIKNSSLAYSLLRMRNASPDQTDQK